MRPYDGPVNSRLRRALSVPFAALIVVTAVAVLLPAAEARFAGDEPCSGAACDQMPPVLALTSPVDGALTGDWVVVAGTATDDERVSAVLVRLGDTTVSFPPADGGTFSRIIDTTFLPDGTHRVTVEAVDPAGNRAEQSAEIVLDATAEPAPELTARDRDAQAAGPGSGATGPDQAVALPPSLHRTLLAHDGTTGSLVVDGAGTPWVAFEDAASNSSVFPLPSSGTFPRDEALHATLVGRDHLFVASGSGPVTVHHFALSWDGALPNGATFVETDPIEATGAVVDDLVGLPSGAVVLAWHQADGSGRTVVARTPQGAWDPVPGVPQLPTTEQALGVHPADGSLWLFGVHPETSSVGVTHLVDGPVPAVDWSDDQYLSSSRAFLFGPDARVARVAVNADREAGELVVAYASIDSADVMTTAGPVPGNRVTVGWLGATRGEGRFVHGPEYAVPTSRLAVVARGGTVGLAARDAANPDAVVLRRFDGTTWSTLDVLSTSSPPLASAAGPVIAVYTGSRLRRFPV